MSRNLSSMRVIFDSSGVSHELAMLRREKQLYSSGNFNLALHQTG